jgi:hypothetical protein
MFKFNLLESIYNISLDVVVRDVGEGNFNDFVFLPYRLYAKDEGWIPPLHKTRMNYLNIRKNSLLRDCDYAAYLAYRHNLPVGSIVCGVFPEPAANRRIAFFCLFEAEDMEGAKALLEKAEDYAKERYADILVGPWSPDDPALGAGFILEDAALPAGYLNEYNKKEYEGYAEELGYKKYRDLYTYCFNLDALIDGECGPGRLANVPPEERLEAMRREEFRRYHIKAVGLRDEKCDSFAYSDISRVRTDSKEVSFKEQNTSLRAGVLSHAHIACGDGGDYGEALGRLLRGAKDSEYYRLTTAPLEETEKDRIEAIEWHGGKRLNTYRIYQKTLDT